MARFRDRTRLHGLALGRQLVLRHGSHAGEGAHPFVLVLAGNGGAELADAHECALVARRIRGRAHEGGVTHEATGAQVDALGDRLARLPQGLQDREAATSSDLARAGHGPPAIGLRARRGHRQGVDELLLRPLPTTHLIEPL